MKKILFTVLTIIFFSCRKEPNYSDVPKIDFNRVEHYQIFRDFNFEDSLNIKLNFEDGNGDLGLDPDDINGNDKFTGKFAQNYFCTLLKKKDTSWVEVDKDLNGTYLRLLETGAGPIDGILNYAVIINPLIETEIIDGDSIKFEIYILDRALNQSNTISTNSIVLGQGLVTD